MVEYLNMPVHVTFQMRQILTMQVFILGEIGQNNGAIGHKTL